MTTYLPAPVLLEPGRHSWRLRAACAGHSDPDIFYPKPKQCRRAAAAKLVCATCPVATACLDDAIETGDRYGIRAGKTEEERARYHRALGDLLRHDVILAAADGEDVYPNAMEARVLACYVWTEGIPITVWAPVLGIGRKAALKRLVRARAELANPKLAPQRQQELAELRARRERQIRRPRLTAVAA